MVDEGKNWFKEETVTSVDCLTIWLIQWKVHLDGWTNIVNRILGLVWSLCEVDWIQKAFCYENYAYNENGDYGWW